MAVDTSALLADAQCILGCVPPGMIEAAQLAQLVSLNQATVVTANAVVVSGNGIQLLADNPKRRYAVVLNTSGGSQVFVGPSTVTTSGSTQGALLAVIGQQELARMFFYTTAALFAASAGANVRVLDFSMP